MQPGRSDHRPLEPSRRVVDQAPGRHAIRDQEMLWADFIALANGVVDSVAKSVLALCEGRADAEAEVKSFELESDREEERIERQCMRVLALFEPVASDLRRLATILKVSRDWERIADLAARIARRAAKLASSGDRAAVPERLKLLAHAVLEHVTLTRDALVARDAARARAVLEGEASIDRMHRRVRKEIKESLRPNPETIDLWLQMLSTARNLERVADHAADIARTVVYLEEGIMMPHDPSLSSISD